MATIWDRYYNGMSLEQIKAINPFASENWLGNGEGLSQKRIDQIEALFGGQNSVNAERIRKFGSNFGRYAAFRAIVHGIAIDDGMKGIIRIEKSSESDIYPDEVKITPEERFYEGSLRQVTVNAYERDSEARQKCIDFHGLSCKICGFDFEKTYGKSGKGFIHVHHLKPLSEIGEKYEVDPILDLYPVCPNCHGIIHRRKTPYSIEEVKQMIKA